MKGISASAAVLMAAAGFAALLSGCQSISSPAESRAAASSPQGDSWASIAKLPDWGGVWTFQFTPPKGVKNAVGLGPMTAKPPLTPKYEAKYEAFKNLQKEGKAPEPNTWNCVPYPFPSSMRLPYPIEFLFTPGKVTIAIESDSLMRRIFTDGRELPEDPDLSYQGYTIGHWEGDTLVTETEGLVPDMKITAGVGHSDKMRIEERIHLVEPDTLEIATTITDPVVLTEPWTTTTFYKRHRDWDIQEYVCLQNNRDHVDSQGRPSMDLTRKPGE